MTALWTTEELPGQRFDPEPPPDDEDTSPWCNIPTDLAGQGADPNRLATMNTITVQGGIL